MCTQCKGYPITTNTTPADLIMSLCLTVHTGTVK